MLIHTWPEMGVLGAIKGYPFCTGHNLKCTQDMEIPRYMLCKVCLGVYVYQKWWQWGHWLQSCGHLTTFFPQNPTFNKMAIKKFL